MSLRCPTCGSTDLWRPRRRKSAFDRLLERCGYQRLDCRGCWRRPILRIEKREDYQEAPAAAGAEIAPAISGEETTDMTAGAAPAQLTVIGPTMLIRGDVRAGEDVQLLGQLEGTLHMNDSLLVIEQGARVTAMVRAARVVVRGLLVGDTVASESLTVCRDGSLIGQIRTGSLVVEDGACLKSKLETAPASEIKLQNFPDTGGEG
jgi:cytoskeletal protein CcmA (bactofilin family)